MTPSQAIRQGSRSFALASLFLPPASREQAHLLYQWCRICDDLIDEAPDLPTARQKLDLLERSVSGPSSYSAPSWVHPRERDEFIAGLRMDVEQQRYRSLRDLELYCHRVAGVVGLMMCPLLGAHPEKATPHADALGKAMQLTNIARDIQADARIGRVYIPEELLPAKDALELAETPERAFEAVKVLLARADQWYAEGFRGIRWLPWKTAFAIAVAGKVYQRIGHKLLIAAEKEPSTAFRRRTVVSPFEKLVAVFAALFIVIREKGTWTPSEISS